MGTIAGAKALAAAHARLMGDRAIQFSFTPVPKTPDFVEPEWLKTLGRWIGSIAKFLAPYAIDLFWMGVGAAILALLYLILRELMG
ncbi:MAG: hypothetical protein ACREEB_07285, partial [Caulobacteraceae bacterium]